MIKNNYSGNFDLVGKIIYLFSAEGKIPGLQITSMAATIQGGKELFSDNP